MDIRNISPGDWDTLVAWGIDKNKDLLPKDGTGGLLVHLENIPIAAGFIYLTNSKLAFINDIIYDKDKDEKLLHNSLDLLIVAFEQTLKELGFKSIIVIGTNEMLNDSYKALGWKEDEIINKLIKNI
jgi:hypothetical protein|tara:strand:- start:443 stop:823 length:381 start_codon:yes stop_codon:yes gene_type:complete